MSSRKKIIINIVLFIGCFCVAGAAIVYNYSYKMCWNCSTADYYQRGKEFACRDKGELRQTGIDFLRLAAERDNSDAQILLAECYLGKLPDGYVSRDPIAFNCLNDQLRQNTAAATQLFSQAYNLLEKDELTDHQQLFNFAVLVEQGVIKSSEPKKKAHSLYLQAAKRGNVIAMNALGYQYHRKSDYIAAKKWLRLAAEAGKSAEPALTLGDYFYYGKGETVNYEKAIQWYRVALKTQQSLAAKLPEQQRIAALDAPMARIEMAMLQLKKTRMTAPMSLQYSVTGNATHYVVYSEDRPEGAIGSVKKTTAGATATINDDITVALSIPTTSKTFESMNEGMDWLLQSYARSRYGSYTRVTFSLKK